MPRISKKRAEQAMSPLTPGDKEVLLGNPKIPKRLTEFMDKDHSVMMEYYDVTEAFVGGVIEEKEAVAGLKELIKKDPNFLDTYILLARMASEHGDSLQYGELITKAYNIAVDTIASKNGEYPKELPWAWLENRHIIRALDGFALYQWQIGNPRLALEIYRKLLASNLGDNIGARFHIIALLLGYNADYEDMFVPDSGDATGLDVGKTLDWYDEHSPKFKSELLEFTQNAKQWE